MINAVLPPAGMQRNVKKGWLHHAYWILYTVATVYSFTITISFWTIMHDPGTFARDPIFQQLSSIFRSLSEQDKFDAINLMVYVFDSTIMLVDLMIVTHPITLAHTYWTMGIGIAYTIFTAIYFLFGGTSRYTPDSPFTL